MKLIILNNNHENETLLEGLRAAINLEYEFIPIPPGKTNSYTIEEIRVFTKTLSIKKNINNSNHFYILTGGDSMSHIVQNALLKTLEESAYPIGISVRNAESLLPTIRSRCQILNLNQVNDSSPSNADIDYASFAKLDRPELILKLENYIANSTNYRHVEVLQHALDMIKANCKIEAIMMDLERKMIKFGV